MMTACPRHDRARHQGLDLGAARPCPECGFDAPGGRRADRGPAGDPRQRHALGGRARAPTTRPSGPSRRRGRRWSTPATSATCTGSSSERLALDAGPRTTRTSPTGTRTRPRSRSGYVEQDPATVARRGRRGGRRGRRARTTPVPHGDAVGAGAACAATAASSPSTPSPATTCTTSSTTPTTSRHVAKRVTVASYDAYADDVRRRHAARCPTRCGRASTAFVAALSARARACSRSAAAAAATPSRSRSAGLRSGVPTSRPAFVDAAARRRVTTPTSVDPLTDDLADPEREAPYDGVWATACLLHVGARTCRWCCAAWPRSPARGGRAHLAVKEGDGARFSTHGHVAAPRHFTFWREEPLRDGARRGRLGGRRGRPRRRACAASRVARRDRPSRQGAEAPMRHTEFWARMEARARAGVRPGRGPQFVIAELGGRTAAEALDAGVPPKEVWAAVWRALELPPSER